MSTFFSAASQQAADATAALITEAAAFTAPSQALDPAFIERCAAADTLTLANVKNCLRNLKGCSIRDFTKLVSEETARIKILSRANVNGYVNGHANGTNGHAGSAPQQGNLLDHLLNDHGNACRIADLYGEDLRYCYETKTWMVWDGMRWANGDIGQARQFAKQTMLEFLRLSILKGDREHEKFAKESLDVRRINAMLTMLESDLPIRAAELDVNPWLLNCLNGTVDLRKANLYPHDRSDYITKLVHYEFDPTATCPLWIDFLKQIMGANPDALEETQPAVEEMIDYLQRALGYSCTGSTSEKAVFVPFGSGNNGKSTMLTVVRQILSEYSTLIQVDTLMTRQENNNTQSDLADLRGARFVQTSETEEGQKLSQGKLKRITQGMGTIRAARKYENMIEFPETHKLWMDTNKKPEIRDAEDQALFNRLHPIPFNITITEIDKQFSAKLLAQAKGILAWLVTGAAHWFQDQSLHRPAAVDSARADWQVASAQISRFISDATTQSPASKSPSKAVYSAYKNWCANGNERPFPSPVFVDKLKSHGFPTKKEETGNFVLGLHILVTNSVGETEIPFDDGSNSYRQYPD